MDAVFLARLQFAFAAGFHYLFPPTTFGLTFVILIVESVYLRTGNVTYKRISGMLVKMLGLVFVMGAAIGMPLVIFYTYFVFKTFKGKVNAVKIEALK